jgi:hypothetical protein
MLELFSHHHKFFENLANLVFKLHLNLNIMKNLIFTFLLSFIVISCHRSSDNSSPLEQLPAATQTGASTAGCLVNGNVLIAKGNFSKIFTWGPPIHANYYFYGGYNFNLSFENQNASDLPNIFISLSNINIEEGKTYPLSLDLKDETKIYGYANFSNTSSFQTNEINKGEITITKFDTKNFIISGTFWFDGINSNGDKVKITEGRFDTKY